MGDVSWEVVVLTVVGGLFTGGMGVALIDWIRNRNKDRVDVTSSAVALMEQVSTSLHTMTNEAQADSKEARQEAKAAQSQAREAQSQAREAHTMAHETMLKLFEVQQLAEKLMYRLRCLTGAILDENVSRSDLENMARKFHQID